MISGDNYRGLGVPDQDRFSFELDRIPRTPHKYTICINEPTYAMPDTFPHGISAYIRDTVWPECE